MRTKQNFRTRVLSAGMALGISLVALPTSALLAQSPEGAVTADGFIVRNGQIYQLRNGQATPLRSDAVMRITPAGEITGFDGQRRRLNENTVLTLDGRVLPAPPGVVFSAPLPTAGAEAQVEDRFAQQREQQRATSGENLSGLAPGIPGRQTPAAANAQGQATAPASNAVPSTGHTVRDKNLNRENMNSNTWGIVDPVTGLPYGNIVVPVVDGNQQNSSTTGQVNSTNVPANSSNASNSNANVNRSNAPSQQEQRGTADPGNVNANSNTANANGVQNGTQAQTGAANSAGTSTNANQTSQPNMNGATSTQQVQPQGNQEQGTQTQQPQGFSRQGVGTNSGASSGTGPQSRPNSTNATQGGNGPTDRVNSSNASGGTGSARSTGTGSTSGSGGGGSSGGSAGSGSGGGSGAGGTVR